MRFFLMTLERLDTETLPEAILAVLRVLHKNLSSSFDLFFVWDLRWGLADLFLKKRYFIEAKPSCCHLFYLHAPFLTDMPLLPHAKIFHLTVKTRYILPLTCGAPALLLSTNQMPLKEI